MAATSVPINSTVLVKYEAGVTSEGSPVIRQKTFNDVKISASDQDIYDVITALFSLSIHPMVQSILRKNYDLIDL